MAIIQVIFGESIWSCLVLAKEGYRWVVGDGSKIKVWLDPWLRDSHTLKINSPIPSIYDNLMVKDLMAAGSKSWDG